MAGLGRNMTYRRRQVPATYKPSLVEGALRGAVPLLDCCRASCAVAITMTSLVCGISKPRGRWASGHPGRQGVLIKPARPLTRAMDGSARARRLERYHAQTGAHTSCSSRLGRLHYRAQLWLALNFLFAGKHGGPRCHPAFRLWLDVPTTWMAPGPMQIARAC